MSPGSLLAVIVHLVSGFIHANAFRNILHKLVKLPDFSLDKDAKTGLQRIEDNVKLVQTVYRSLNDSTTRIASKSIARDAVFRVVDSLTGEITTRAADVLFPAHGHHDPMYWGLKAFLYDFSMTIWSNSLYSGDPDALPFILSASPNDTIELTPSYRISNSPSFSSEHPSPIIERNPKISPRYLIPIPPKPTSSEVAVSRANRLICYLLVRFVALMLLHTFLHVSSDAIVHATFLQFPSESSEN